MNRSLLTLLSAPPTVADRTAEQHLAAVLAQGADIQGSVVELTGANGPFLAIHRPQQRGEGRGGVVLLHGRASSADSLEVIRPLRLGLAEAGWDTLALQLPPAYGYETAADWQARAAPIQARLQAGLAWLKGRELRKQIIVAHGESGAIALDFAASEAPPELQALVLVSATSAAPGGADDRAALGRLELPVLDIHAQRDPAAADAAAARHRAASNLAYRRVVITGALPDFRATADTLLARIRAWLAAQADGRAIDRAP